MRGTSHFLLVCGAALSFTGVALAQDDVGAGLERRVQSVNTLIEKSSGAKQIEATGNADALTRRNRARELLKQAEAALWAGDLEASARLLDEAAKTMVEAVRMAAPEQVNGQKDKRDFETRLESARALLDAQKRVATEKSNASAQELAKMVETSLQRANQLRDSGKLSEAIVVLDQAYLTSKAALANMRAGDTLVRSLQFSSKEEEYRYELDRNDTHQMLIKVLLAEKRDNAGVDQMVQKFSGEAGRLRKLAEGQAATGDYESAIKRLEESTKELVKAIRGAGIYIPG